MVQILSPYRPLEDEQNEQRSLRRDQHRVEVMEQRGKTQEEILGILAYHTHDEDED